MARTSIILLVEDDENDILLMERAYRKNQIQAELQVAHDGVEGYNYLCGKGAYNDREKYPLPLLILMDIKMPRMNGLELLGKIRSELDLKRIPVVVTSSSTIQNDIDEAYGLGANAFLPKPVDFENFLKLFQLVAEFYNKYAAKPRFRACAPAIEASF